jgi:hypothetical protein
VADDKLMRDTLRATGVKSKRGTVDQAERVKDVHFIDDALAVDLIDGRRIIVPLVWYPRLLGATPEQRCNWTVSGAGYGVHWPDVDEDLSTAGLLRGAANADAHKGEAADGALSEPRP